MKVDKDTPSSNGNQASRSKDRSRSRSERHHRSKSKSRERKRRGSSERGDSKKHRSSRISSRSNSPGRSHSRGNSRGNSSFHGRQYSPPRKRPKHSCSPSNSPAPRPKSLSPAEYAPSRAFFPSRGPGPYDARWPSRGFEGPMHHEPLQYDSYRPPGAFYGGQPPPRRWATGPPSRFGGRPERRSPPPHWTGPVNPTTGSPMHERPVAVEGPRERALGGWDPAGPPQRGSSQWGTSSGWERIGQDARPVSPGASLRHSPISPLHEYKESTLKQSTISPQLGFQSAGLTHSPISPPHEASVQPVRHSSVPPDATDHHSKAQHGGRNGPGEDASLKAADIGMRGLKAAGMGPAEEDGRYGRQPTGSPGHMQRAMLPRAAVAAGVHAAGDAAPDSSPQAEAPLQHPLPTGTASALQQAVGSSKAASASQQAASQVVQRAAERLKALVLGADYSEKNWYYVDPQGVTQGPCSISEFRGWMHDLRMDQQLSFQYKQFSEVSAWQDGAPFSVKMKSLIAVVAQLSPSPPSSPTPRDTKLAGNNGTI